MKDWYEKSFGEDYLLVYKHRDIEGAAREVKTMISWLDLPPGAQVLDLCCGTGRHSLALVDAGYRVTGVDLSDVLLREARRLDTKERVDWRQADMRELPLEGGFDAVVNLFTSFGYFREDGEQLKVLREIRRMLKPGGWFIIDFMNSPYVRRHLVPASEREEEGQRIVEKRRIEGDFVIKDISISDMHGTKGTREYHERVKLYTRGRLEEMLQEAGLMTDEVYGGYNEEVDYDEGRSQRMIFVGRRPQEEKA
ncbi:class I SAM-dependent methyltransferase [Paenibacillus sp. S28]|uniref:class I SAM-dependent methyltransferase n=1 Tax=Paenibacillus sp. S28 TaxID=2767463 RepID=UPI0019092682|nr:class I SAM-dependent methyltransferase [Paenibacillus sp. S28]MBJ9992245.1 methyltransferase domain-containing protein [Paenibacillus sp. S28]